jgi:FKBP-type peptidyl-prolyl cis-trans isomerase FkpA
VKQVKFLSIVVAAVALATAGCKQAPKYTKFNNSLDYKIYADGKGEKAKDGQIALMRISRIVGDSVMYSSDKENGGEPMPNPIRAAADVNDPSALILKMRAGDSIVMKYNADSAFHGQTPDFYKKGDDILLTVKLDKLFKDEAEFQAYNAKKQEASAAELKPKEDKIIAEYLAKNNLTAQKTAKGTYYVITTPGAGANAAQGNTCVMNYTGSLLDGTKFDSNIEKEFGHAGQPFEFPVGEGRVIPGWDDALQMFNKGSKGILLIPSYLAYGKAGSPPKIPSNSVLRFDVEVKDIKAANAPKAAPQAPVAEAPAEALTAPAGK